MVEGVELLGATGEVCRLLVVGGGAERNLISSSATLVVRVESFSISAGSFGYLVGGGGVFVALSSSLVHLNRTIMTCSTEGFATASNFDTLLSE